MNYSNQPTLAGLEIDIKIHSGRDLVAKDRGKFGLGKPKSSDPYIEVYFAGKRYGNTQVIYKNLNPKWDRQFKIELGPKEALNVQQSKHGFQYLSLRVFDHDDMSSHDFMGACNVPLVPGKPPTTAWYTVNMKEGNLYCWNAKGEIQVTISVAERKVLDLIRGNSHKLLCSSINVFLQWHAMEYIDLDTSCVAISTTGQILMEETVYFGDLANSNGSILHSGDERQGGKHEVITCHLSHVSHNVAALFFIVSVASKNKVLADVQSALVTVSDAGSGYPICNFRPSVGGDYTSMFLMRVARDFSSGEGWIMTNIEDFDHTARDFGALIPEIKGYSRDIIPNIKVNPKEYIALLKKGEAIRIDDYKLKDDALHRLVFGLAWDVTHGRSIDLDASAICLDANYALVDIISYQQLRSMDGSIAHGGDEREGDEVGDDEKIFINLDSVRPEVYYIGFVINSFSGQELDDVQKASCHLFNEFTKRDLVCFKLSNDKALDGHTALVMACVYRCQNKWNLRIIGEAAHGQKAVNLVDELQNFLYRNPPPVPNVVPDAKVCVNAMPAPVPIVDAFPVPSY